MERCELIPGLARRTRFRPFKLSPAREDLGGKHRATRRAEVREGEHETSGRALKLHPEQLHLIEQKDSENRADMS